MTPREQIDADLRELRDVADFFRRSGKIETANFLAACANRYEVVSGAYHNRMTRIDATELVAMAHNCSSWSGGAFVFDAITYGRAIEKYLGIVPVEAA